MRKLRMCYYTLYYAFVVVSAISFSTVAAVRLESQNSAAPKGDSEVSVESRPAEVPISGLSESIEALLEEKQAPDDSLSDRKFDELSEAWKLGVRQVVGDKRCKRVSSAFKVGKTLNPLLREANVIVESNCNPTAIGDAEEVGLFQPKPSTCKALGVTGDLTNPIVNAKCAEAHRQSVCKEVGDACTDVFLFLAHNRGVTGARRVKNPKATTYLRRIDYAREVLEGGI